eukprot:TRINITY_DN230_c0_g1_i1.p1 TRINITY_DN230_c0_g1~~TRINITY_DN230_c0_g1_i1.p1  ORF type:complete len:392 (-),score=154.44 TRINITY_DN230_c0_g1_i1:601-1776(-)
MEPDFKKRKVEAADTTGVESRLMEFLMPMDDKDIKQFLAHLAATIDPVYDALMEKLNGNEEIRKIFVRGLNDSISQEALTSFFAQYGKVQEIKIVTDRETGRCKGYGFVTFSTVQEAENASNHQEGAVGDTSIQFNLAIKGKKQAPTLTRTNPQSANASFTPSSTADFDDKKLFIFGLADRAEDDDVRRCFEQYGPLSNIHVVHDTRGNRPKHYAFVNYERSEDCKSALEQPNKDICGRRCTACYADERKLQNQGQQGQHQQQHQQQQQPQHHGMGAMGAMGAMGMPQMAGQMGGMGQMFNPGQMQQTQQRNQRGNQLGGQQQGGQKRGQQDETANLEMMNRMAMGQMGGLGMMGMPMGLDMSQNMAALAALQNMQGMGMMMPGMMGQQNQ